MKILILTMFFVLISTAVQAATSIPFTINMSEVVSVTGTPRIAVDVGGVTKYANYTSGSGTSALTFTYDMQPGDVDLDGVALVSPIDLNGGTMTDASGNNATLTFTPPDTSGVKANFPSLGMDFIADADGRYTLNGTVYNDLPSFLTATGGTFTRNSIGTYFDSAGVMQTTSANQPRFDHDPVTFAPKGILIEEQRTNLLTRSTEFENGVWSKEHTIITTNADTAPDGTMSADKISDNNLSYSASPQIRFTSTPTLIYNAIYSFSVYAKKDQTNWIFLRSESLDFNRNTYFNINTGLVGLDEHSSIKPAEIQFVGNGWYRCTIFFSSTTDLIGSVKIALAKNNGQYSMITDGTASAYIWGAQLEVGDFPTSYIPTTTAAAGRENDYLSLSTSGWYNEPEGSLFFNFSSTGTSGGKFFVAEVTDSANRNRAIYLGNTSVSRAQVLDSGFVNQATLQASLNSPIKSALSYKTNDFSASFGGAVAITDNSGTVPVGLNSLRLGLNQIGNQGAAGNIMQFKYYPTRIPNTQLQIMTQ